LIHESTLPLIRGYLIIFNAYLLRKNNPNIFILGGANFGIGTDLKEGVGSGEWEE